MADKNSVCAAVVCHKGCVRANNEDNFFFNGCLMALREMNNGAMIEHTFQQKVQYYAIFDGMGGGDSGERASAIAAQGMQQVYTSAGAANMDKRLRDFCTKANARIVRDALLHGAKEQGTTAAILALVDSTSYVTNVGDSRVYRLRDGELEQLSTDHALVADMVRQGQLTREQARKSEKNNVITSYLGMDAENIGDQKIAQAHFPVKQGDRFMLCSDGLCDLLSDESIAARMLSLSSPLECARQLVADALEMSGKDNTTCIVADVGPFRASQTPITPPWLLENSGSAEPEYPPVAKREVKETPPPVNTEPLC